MAEAEQAAAAAETAATQAAVAVTETAEAEAQATQAAAAAATAATAAEGAVAAATTTAALANAAAAETVAQAAQAVRTIEEQRDAQWTEMQTQLVEQGAAIKTLAEGMAALTMEVAALKPSTPPTTDHNSQVTPGAESGEATRENHEDRERKPGRRIRRI